VTKKKLHSYNALEKEKSVSFGNDTPAIIKGKGFVFLKEKVKVGNVMYVDGSGETMNKGTRTPNNLYILKGGQQQCYLSKNDENLLWHRRLGHLSFSQIRKACSFYVVHDLPDINIPENTICKSCQFSKKTRYQFIEKEGSTGKPLELVHTDLCGPSRKKSPHGEEYFILFIDDFSRMCWTSLLKHKDEAFEKFEAFKALVENESYHKIKCFRSDRGGEFTSN